jgi:hypothetical protein
VAEWIRLAQTDPLPEVRHALGEEFQRHQPASIP